MPFTCTLPKCEIASSGETLTFPIGYDEVSSYSVVMGFVLLDYPEHREFYFSVYRYDHVTNVTEAFSSGRHTKAYIPDAGHRALIVRAVCEAIPTLLEIVRPEWVLRITNDSNLPPGATAKHSAIADAFESCGYEEHQLQDRAGCKAWWMWNGGQ
jgi:hypothetical protein